MNLQHVYTFTEAAEKWNLSDGSVLRNAVRSGRLEERYYKQSGKVWLVVKEGMEKLYGTLPQYSILGFVQEKDNDINGFGVIADILRGSNDQKPNYHVMFADMPEDFGVIERNETELLPLSDEEIKEKMAYIHNHVEDFVYFIIQINDIPELSEYHLEEDDFIKEKRAEAEAELY